DLAASPSFTRKFSYVIRPLAQGRYRPLGTPLRGQRRSPDRLRRSHRFYFLVQRLVQCLVGARSTSRAAGPSGVGEKVFPHSGRMPATRRRLLSFCLLPVRARSGADESRAQKADRMSAGCTSSLAAARRTRRNSI